MITTCALDYLLPYTTTKMPNHISNFQYRADTDQNHHFLSLSAYPYSRGTLLRYWYKYCIKYIVRCYKSSMKPMLLYVTLILLGRFHSFCPIFKRYKSNTHSYYQDFAINPMEYKQNLERITRVTGMLLFVSGCFLNILQNIYRGKSYTFYTGLEKEEKISLLPNTMMVGQFSTSIARYSHK